MLAMSASWPIRLLQGKAISRTERVRQVGVSEIATSVSAARMAGIANRDITEGPGTPAASAQPDEDRRDHRAQPADALGPADPGGAQGSGIEARQDHVDPAIGAEAEEAGRAQQQRQGAWPKPSP